MEEEEEEGWDAAHRTTQLPFSRSLPLAASSQSAETPCVSAKQWSIPSVYFTFFFVVVVPPAVSLPLAHPLCLLLILSLLIVN